MSATRAADRGCRGRAARILALVLPRLIARRGRRRPRTRAAPTPAPPPPSLLARAGRLPGCASAPPPRSGLCRKLGGGRFEDVTAKAGVGGPDRYGFGCTAADVDGDGDRDLYVTYYGPNVLYRNNGDGTFTDVTTAAGVGSPLWSTSAGFAEPDGDGDLDLYVAN